MNPPRYIRPIELEDWETIARMIERDPDHTARGMTADFFFAPGVMNLAFEDLHGPVFFVRLDPEMSGSVRVHIQFDTSQPLRTVRTLSTGFTIVKERCEVAGATRMVFDSLDGKLRQFCMRHFGFQAITGTADLELMLKGAADVRR